MSTVYFKDLEITFTDTIVLLDIDGTITFDSQDDIDESYEKVQEIKENNNRVYLCSNTRNDERVKKISKRLGIDCILSRHQKPSPKVLHNSDLKDMSRKNMIVIGDKLITDGWFAKKLRVSFIKVKRLSSSNDSLLSRIVHRLDDILFWLGDNFVPYIKLVRPHHWIKNVLVFAPLFFAGSFFERSMFIRGIWLFVAFSVLASAIYILNDIHDRKEDSMHPIKKNRPIASGRIGVFRAIIIMIGLLGIGSMISFSFPFETQMVLGGYVLLNLLYSSWLKHQPIVDIFMVAFMYVLRIYAGGTFFVIDLSVWIILCTFFLALFLVIAKRRSEFNALGESASRKVMHLYNNAFLDHMLTISTTFCLMSYSFYLVSFGNSPLIFAFFFVLFGIMRYLYLVYRYNMGESPEIIVIKDPWMLISIVAWILYNTYFLYYY